MIANAHCRNYFNWFSTGLLSLWRKTLSTAHHYKQLPDLVLIKGSDKSAFRLMMAMHSKRQ